MPDAGEGRNKAVCNDAGKAGQRNVLRVNVHRFGIHCTSWLIMMGAEIGVIYRAKPEDIGLMPDYQRYWLYSTIVVMILFSYILCRAY